MGQVEAKYVVTNEHKPLGDEVYPNYVILRGDLAVVGGTYMEGNMDGKLHENEIKHLEKTAHILCPPLKGQKPKASWIGFRPVRNKGIRFEAVKEYGIQVFHNYGHGGSGWTIFEGSTIAQCEGISSYLQNLKKT